MLIIAFLPTIIWTVQITNGYMPYMDQWTRELVIRVENTTVYEIFFTITNLGSREFLLPFVLLLTIIIRIIYRKWLPAIIFSGGTYITYKLNGWMKNLIQRERPSILEEANAIGNSFPSGHAMISTVCYGLLAYFLTKKIKSKSKVTGIQITLFSIIFLIGISRYMINVHYLTDVLAGYVIGLICMVSFLFLFEISQAKQSPPQVRGKSHLQ
ncbi:phosphatase PAP2 family protein [Oceanobacillus halophilus]|uniref:Phosphatase PAP2 family protein n=2 Tax=Oceanobacillus halophilus TaxID=930130 RepID=A0A494ZXM8_9BACI|nr:phosphatase PAP2 family protein [Oceanobacillus halophilus]